ncbi:NADH dehydrogenase [ubiquinone] iron-sulfur protein 5-B [Smittium culicis]|uniref:NADH dehydrogenase [ubiquinone] iron-sulfur protein 5 n=1 Tax=Smittium culicis TaxID=133412 RepID=A0A1R1Y1I6_9FUNG|nr:NADH dehydrogenase [ubiquinone] iron-sulfur protein 5-B [Smittium culicis]OMJ23523.1 NADH dehydrogenase [ubiquinone] iron-sulfur protein 5-B [Smittium culicis]
MASGFGYNGQNRCFPFWQDFEKCYILSPQDNKSECRAKKDDYMECLHHFKEQARVNIIKAAEIKNYKNSSQVGSKHKIIDLSDTSTS